MATSGRVNQTTLSALTVIEKAARKCGVQPSILASEQLSNALSSLSLILIALSNRGVNLWAVDKRIVVPQAGQVVVELADDTVDILNATYRTVTSTAPTSYPTAGSARYDFGVGLTGSFSGAILRVEPVAGGATPSLPDPNIWTAELTLAYSDDAVTWTTAGYQLLPNVKAGWYVGVDSNILRPSRYWQLTVGPNTTSPVLSSVWFVSSPNDIPMSKLSRDSYSSYPNKYSQSSQPLQFFFDKQTPNPLLRLWPSVATFGPQLVLWIQRQLQDAEFSYNLMLDVPQRWLNAVIFKLAMQINLELPKEVAIEGRQAVLEKQAESAVREAEDGETDGAPVRISPNIGCYTGG